MEELKKRIWLGSMVVLIAVLISGSGYSIESTVPVSEQGSDQESSSSVDGPVQGPIGEPNGTQEQTDVSEGSAQIPDEESNGTQEHIGVTDEPSKEPNCGSNGTQATGDFEGSQENLQVSSNSPGQWSNGSEDNGKAQNKAGYLGQYGKFEVEDGSVDGRYVQFNCTSGTITDYSWSEDRIVLFDSIDLGVEDDLDIRTDGAILMLNGNAISVLVHNNPTGHIRINYNGTSGNVLTFVIGEGLTLNNSNTRNVTFDGPSGPARLWVLNATISFVGSTISILLDEDAHIMFIMQPMAFQSKVEEALNVGLSKGKVDTRMIVDKAGADYDFPYEGKVKTTLKEMNSGESIRIEIESDEHAGKVVSFRFENGTVTREMTKICIDEMEMEKASDPDEVLYASSGKALYYTERLGDGSQEFLVYVPGFSVHELSFTVGDDSPEVPFLSMAILVGVVLIVVVLSAVIVRKRP